MVDNVIVSRVPETKQAGMSTLSKGFIFQEGRVATLDDEYPCFVLQKQLRLSH
jgi:hypothetical protein